MTRCGHTEKKSKGTAFSTFYFLFLYSHKIYNDKQLQYKSKGSMEVHNNPKTYTKSRDTNITETVTRYLATKG